MLALGEIELVGQLEHTAGPVPVLYCPGVHAVHVPPLAPVKPALHVQAAIAVLPLGEIELVGQLEHGFASDALFHNPAAHGVHLDVAVHEPSNPVYTFLELAENCIFMYPVFETHGPGSNRATPL